MSFSLAIILLIAFSLESCVTIKPVRGTKHVVLLVNTTDISDGAEAKNYCSFPYQHGVLDSEYKTHVFQEDTVVWLGVSTSSVDDIVVINKVDPQGRHNVLGAAAEADGILGVEGRVTGIIAADAKRGKKTYYIEFSVTKDGSSTSYTLDPILRVH